MLISQHAPGRRTILATACALSLLATGCSSVGDLISNDKVDYRSSGNKTATLEVPPDLTQLSGQGRYTHASAGTVSATTFGNQQAQSSATPQGAAIAASSLGGVTLQRDGQLRWLSVDRPPEQIWATVRDFWVENGFDLPVDQAQTGLLETNWSENRAKLKQDGLRQLVGKVLDSLIDTGERDQFRTRIERTSGGGSEIYVSHRGLIEMYTDSKKEQTTWKTRPADPLLEAQMLSRLMVKLGAGKDAASAAVSANNATTAVAPRAQLSADGLTLNMAGDFDQAWRRVGLALDRGGFTVVDRDRTNGVYEVRLASSADQGKPGLFERMSGWFGSKPSTDTLTHYRIKVASQSGASSVTVQTTSGKPAESAGGKDVTRLLSTNLD